MAELQHWKQLIFLSGVMDIDFKQPFDEALQRPAMLLENILLGRLFDASQEHACFTHDLL